MRGRTAGEGRAEAGLMQFKFSRYWTPTGGLFAIAAALLVLAVATGNSIFSHRYEFTSSSFVDGQAVWRGDTVTGSAVLCVTDHIATRLETDDRTKALATRC